MEIYLSAACIILICVVVSLLIRQRLMQKSADEIRRAFEERLTGDTNTLIDISSHDKYIKDLAQSINHELRLLRNERRRYEQGDLELKEAITNIAHDLRTPLTAIYGYLELLDSEEKSENISRYIGMIRNRSDALRQLTEELFRYSVITSARELSIESVNVNGVLEESLASFYGALTQKNIDPVVSIPERRIERELDKAALSRVFSNIISNVIKYSDGDLEVTMTENAVISFINTAPDLTAVAVGKLFDRFFTVETGRNSTGLGLAIAKLLTERMGGTIRAEYTDKRLRIILEFEADNNIMER